MRHQTSRFFLSDPERSALSSELGIQPLPDKLPYRDSRKVIDSLLDFYSEENADSFWYSLESSLEYALLPYLGHIQVACDRESNHDLQVIVTKIDDCSSTLVHPKTWMPLVDPNTLLTFFTDSFRQNDFSSLYDASIVGADSNANILVGGDRVSGSGKFASQPIVLPQSHLAFLDDQEKLINSHFLVSVFHDPRSGNKQRATRTHALFLRDLAYFSGIQPISSAVNAASGMLVIPTHLYNSRHWAASCHWIIRNANFRNLHVLPPLPKDLSPSAKISYACNKLAMVRVPQDRIYIPGDNQEDRTVRIYAKTDAHRQKLIGPWSGTLRLLSRYSGYPILIYPDSMRPWI